LLRVIRELGDELKKQSSKPVKQNQQRLKGVGGSRRGLERKIQTNKGILTEKGICGHPAEIGWSVKAKERGYPKQHAQRPPFWRKLQKTASLARKQSQERKRN